MSVKISWLRFMEFGKPAPEGSRFQGIIDTESLVGYNRYTNREEAKEDKKAIGIHDGGYFGYTSRESSRDNRKENYQKYPTMSSQGFLESFSKPGDQKYPTMSSQGFLDSGKKRKDFLNQLKESFSKPGDVFYEDIISLSSFDEAAHYGMNTVNNWNALLQEELPKIFKRKGFEVDNMLWWADYHINTEHPHVHLVFLEKEHKTELMKFTPQDLKYMKRRIFTNMAARKDLMEKQNKELKEIFREKDLKFQEITKVVDKRMRDKKYKNVNELIKDLPRTGRLQYNARQMKPYQPIIKKFINETILSDEKTKAAYDEWIVMLDMFEENMNQTAGQDIATFKEAELEKFYTQIGNRILQEGKQKRKRTRRIFSQKYQKEITVQQRQAKYSQRKLVQDLNVALQSSKKQAYEMMMQYEMSKHPPKFEQ